jgi:hypothetical protein
LQNNPDWKYLDAKESFVVSCFMLTGVLARSDVEKMRSEDTVKWNMYGKCSSGRSQEENWPVVGRNLELALIITSGIADLIYCSISSGKDQV